LALDVPCIESVLGRHGHGAGQALEDDGFLVLVELGPRLAISERPADRRGLFRRVYSLAPRATAPRSRLHNSCYRLATLAPRPDRLVSGLPTDAVTAPTARARPGWQATNVRGHLVVLTPASACSRRGSRPARARTDPEASRFAPVRASCRPWRASAESSAASKAPCPCRRRSR